MKKILLSLSALVGFGMLSVQAETAKNTQSFAETAKEFLAKAREGRDKKAAGGTTTEAKKSAKTPRAARRKPRGPGATDSIRSAIQKHAPKRSVTVMSEETKAKAAQARERRQARLATRKTAPTQTKTA